jgi:hypothetical protein
VSTTTPDTTVLRLTLTAGNLGTPGAPILHLYLNVDADNGQVGGVVVQTQAITPPGNTIKVPVHGELSDFGQPAGHRLLVLHGQTVDVLPPPAIGSVLVTFVADFVVNNDWVGTGRWICGATKVTDAPIKPSADSE